ncbi:MAG: hypothetical protein V1899_04360, partial [Planctomycetota bacterium]
LSGLLPIPNGFQVNDQKVIVDVGGVVKLFALDARGKSPKGNDTFVVAVKTSKTGVLSQQAKFAVKLKKGTFAAKLLDDGLVNQTTTASVSLTVPVTVIFNGAALKKAAPQTYKAKQGKTGASK